MVRLVFRVGQVDTEVSKLVFGELVKLTLNDRVILILQAFTHSPSFQLHFICNFSFVVHAYMIL